MKDIIMLAFFALLANADDWVEIEVFGKEHEDFLRNYLELPNGISSHDTLQKVFAMVPSEFLESFQKRTIITTDAMGTQTAIVKKIRQKREYWQTEDISWLSRKKEWVGLRSVILTRNTITGLDGSVKVGKLSLVLNVLKLLEVGTRPLSMKKKRYSIGTNPEKHLEKLMSL